MDSRELLTQIANLLAQARISTPGEFAALRAGLLEALEAVESDLFGDPDLVEAAAEEAVVEVQDIRSGRTLRRRLPLTFRENANGVCLTGETFNGEVAEIVFLSGTSLEKIKDLTGKGPDEPRCGGH